MKTEVKNTWKEDGLIFVLPLFAFESIESLRLSSIVLAWFVWSIEITWGKKQKVVTS